MSSLRRILSSRANGALSRGPLTPEGKRRSSQNAIHHGLLSDCVVLPGESLDTFAEVLAQHVDRFAPADGVELGMIEEMAAAYWRLRRSWAIENALLAGALAAQPPGDDVVRISAAFRQQAASAELALLHRYETRLHLMYQRALHNILLLRVAGMPNEPNPISEHCADSPLPLLPAGDP
ncbi:MAG TPA: hypothetical protein VKT49_13905 [Bryobacteraceae bacterium]|nr:hypothetical protein [Bryobacteraceae bacterium]